MRKATVYACIYRPLASDGPPTAATLLAIAQEFSPRHERHRDDLVSIDVSGLERLLGPPRTIGEELQREAAARGVRVHVALAATRTAALVLAQARPGLTVVDLEAPAAGASIASEASGTAPASGGGAPRAYKNVADALAPIPIAILDKVYDDRTQSSQSDFDQKSSACSAISAFKRWGVKTLGELAALPPADLAARLGRDGLVCQAIARGDDAARPLVPTLPDERFESSLELEWPIEGIEPLSFVLSRLLEPLSTRLERRDRGAAVLHVELRLSGTGLGTCSTRDPSPAIHARSLQLPSPIRDMKTLRTLALLDLESHPPSAAIDRVAVVVDPTPGRIVQHTLFTRARPTAEQLSTLVARLGALMGQDRIGAPATVDSYRPGAFEMKPFATDHDDQRKTRRNRNNDVGGGLKTVPYSGSAVSAFNVVSGLRRCRQPVPARVALADDRPVRVTTDRRGFVGDRVLTSVGPWRTSGEWWAGRAGEAGFTHLPNQPHPPDQPYWNRDEWDVSLDDGAGYRIFRDRATDRWFIDAIAD